MSRKSPHKIMGQIVQGDASSGYSIDIKFYESNSTTAYKPSADDMLNELQSDMLRLERMIDSRTKKLSSKIASETSQEKSRATAKG